jgi:hypothetical protein
MPEQLSRVPPGRLLVVKHRQLARQIGAFGAIAIKSSTNFDNMIFPMGSIFIFGSWVCEVDDKGILQGCLIEALEAREGLTLPTRPTEDLAERLSGLTVAEPLNLTPIRSTCLPLGTKYFGRALNRTVPSSTPNGRTQKSTFNIRIVNEGVKLSTF